MPLDNGSSARLARHEPRDRLDPNECRKISHMRLPESHQNPSRATSYRHRRRALAARALELHRAGRDILQIAAEMEIPASRAGSLLAAALAQLPEFDDADLVAQVDVRLDEIAETFRGLLKDDDPKIRMQAAQNLRLVEADRARLIALGMKT